jgi:hypothetical protein
VNFLPGSVKKNPKALQGLYLHVFGAKATFIGKLP